MEFPFIHIFVLAPRNVAPQVASLFWLVSVEVSFLEQLAFIAQHIHDDVAFFGVFARKKGPSNNTYIY